MSDFKKVLFACGLSMFALAGCAADTDDEAVVGIEEVEGSSLTISGGSCSMNALTPIRQSDSSGTWVTARGSFSCNTNSQGRSLRVWLWKGSALGQTEVAVYKGPSYSGSGTIWAYGYRSSGTFKSGVQIFWGSSNHSAAEYSAGVNL